MRIALCSHEVAGIRGGGIGTYVVEAGKALSAAGHEVWLVTSRPDDDRQSAALRHDPAFREVRFIEDAATPARDVRFALARHALRFAQLAHDLLQQSGQAFDYVEFPDYGAAGAVAVPEQRLFGSFGDAVVAVTLHSPTFTCWEHNQSRHALPPAEREVAVLEDETIRNAPVVWSPSKRLRDITAERLGLAPEFAEVIRYPMTLPAAAPPGPAPRERLADLRVLFFGRIEPRKGIRTLVTAFAQLPELQIECIGGDGFTSPLQTSELEYVQQSATPNVTFTPPLPRARMLERLRAADVVVLPSVWDNWPNTCIEAMAAAKVVVGGRNGGMGEMIEHGRSGFLVDGSDPDALVRVIRDDVGSALPQLPAIGDAAAKRIRELCAPDRYVAAIEDLVRRHRGRGHAPVGARAPGSLVSVVVPYYGEDLAVVGAAVDSAIAQTHEQLEILVVDDGSPRPDKATILDDLARRDPRVRLLHKANGGLASARNFAIEQAQGEVILCLDADNILRPEYAATGLDVLARCPNAMAVVPRLAKFEDRGGEALVVVQPLPYDRPLALLRNSLGDAGGMLRREVFAEHGLRYDSRLDVYSDWALWLDMARLGLRVELVPRVLYDYRVRAGSLMDEQAWDRHLAMLGLLVEHHLPRGASADEEVELLVNLVQGWGVGALLVALSGRSESLERPTLVARRLHKGSMRYVLAEGLGKVADTVPPVRRLAHWAMSRLARVHGRWKDRPRRGKPR